MNAAPRTETTAQAYGHRRSRRTKLMSAKIAAEIGAAQRAKATPFARVNETDV
jgi:hypothetical protein